MINAANVLLFFLVGLRKNEWISVHKSFQPFFCKGFKVESTDLRHLPRKRPVGFRSSRRWRAPTRKTQPRDDF